MKRLVIVDMETDLLWIVRDDGTVYVDKTFYESMKEFQELVKEG